jgi:hypothetical protein
MNTSPLRAVYSTATTCKAPLYNHAQRLAACSLQRCSLQMLSVPGTGCGINVINNFKFKLRAVSVPHPVPGTVFSGGRFTRTALYRGGSVV